VRGRPRDESKLSTDPAQMRRRLRRKHSYFEKDLEKYIAAGNFKAVEDWDLEELAHGKPRNKAGTFSGRVPVWITPDVTREIKKRLVSETFADLTAHAGKAIKVVEKLLDNDEVDEKGRPVVDAATKLKAAQFVLENILGKPTAVIEISDNETVRQAIAAAIMLDDGRPQDEPIILDGTFTEDEED
jgi:hypothetical protein